MHFSSAPSFFGKLCAAVVAFSWAAGDAAAEGRPPNIVFILADDLGIMDVGAYATRLGGTAAEELYYETPNLDALVGRGVAFSQAYANQLCSPTRAAILTGRFASRMGVTTATPTTPTYYNQGLEPPAGYAPHDAIKHKDPIPGPRAWRNATTNTALSPELPTLPRVLADYESAFLGKWHLGGHGALGQQPRDHGFEEIAYFDGGGSAYFNWRQLWGRKKLYYPATPQPVLTAGKPGEPTGRGYLTDDLTVQAQRYLERRAATPDRPFLLYFAHFAVHTPLQAKKEMIKHFAAKPQRGVNGQDNPTYAAMVRSLDESVGALLETLEATGLAGNTLVVFTSDNGGVEYTDPPATDNYPFKGGKACLYEGGVRVPLVFYQPGRFDQGARGGGASGGGGGVWCDAPVNCVDFLPTLASIAGAATPEGVDGRSLVPLLVEPQGPAPERTFYWHYPFNVIVRHPDNGRPLTPHSAIRVGDHKLIWDWQGRLELYDIPRDPFEQDDLAASRPELAERLFERLKAWLSDNVEPRYFPTREPGYDPAGDARPAFRDLWPDRAG